MNDLLLRDVEVRGRRSDVVVRDGVVAEIGPVGGTSAAAKGGRARSVEWDGHGGALIPGLHDHHIHLAATAADRRSVRVGPDEVRGATEMAAALRAAADRLEPDRWLRATGYHETVAGDLDRDVLDRMVGDRPVRVQHRTGSMWVLSSAAVGQLGLDDLDDAGVERDQAGRPTGRIFGLDAWLRGRVPSETVQLAPVGAELAASGVTGVTDATPTRSVDDLRWLADAVATGELPQLVVATGGAALAEAAAPEPLVLGPVKLVIADHDLPTVDRLASDIERAHAAGRNVAVHCVTRVATVVAVAAWDEAGSRPGDRIEHGSVVPPDLAVLVAGHRLTVVTQPSFVVERGDQYQRDVEPADRPWLYRCRGLEDAGIAVAGSTDSPYGSADPWRAMAAAVERRTASGAVMGPDEAVPPARAVDLFLGRPERPGGPPRRVEVGGPADLCLLDAPMAVVLDDLDAGHVRATFRRGRPIHER